jgi:membrane protease YdiL (CAAX protease family)
LVASSAAFGMLHGQWLAGTLAGVGYALVVVRTGRVRDAVFAHAVTNALLMGLMVATGDWQE